MFQSCLKHRQLQRPSEPAFETCAVGLISSIGSRCLSYSNLLLSWCSRLARTFRSCEFLVLKLVLSVTIIVWKWPFLNKLGICSTAIQLAGCAGLHMFNATNRCELSVSALFLPITSGFGFTRGVFASIELLNVVCFSEFGAIWGRFRLISSPSSGRRARMGVLESNSLYCKVLHSEEWLLSSL